MTWHFGKKYLPNERIKNINMQSVPDRYIGVWQRELLETQSTKDTNSLVLLMQSQYHHIDLRIPHAIQVGLRKLNRYKIIMMKNCCYLPANKVLPELQMLRLLIVSRQMFASGYAN